VPGPTGEIIGFRFQWHVNEQPMPGQTGATLSTALLKHGDKIVADIIPNNGKMDGTLYRTAPFLMGNTAPIVLKLTFEPKTSHTGEPVTVLAEVTDTDGDEVRMMYRWSKNGILIQDSSAHSYNGDGLVRGDRLTVEAIASDGQNEGAWYKSDELVVANGAPRITSTPSFTADGGHLVYTVAAVDPDHDPVSFSLAAAPVGMVIDKASGRLDWTPAQAVKGPQRVRVEVHDGHDGTGSQEFDVTVPSILPPSHRYLVGPIHSG
jgi:hypothetical protein